MAPGTSKRLAILGLGAAVAAMTVVFWDDDPWTAVILVGVDLLLFLLLLAGWRQVAQEERDAREIRERRASQRWHAAQLDREHPRDQGATPPRSRGPSDPG